MMRDVAGDVSGYSVGMEIIFQCKALSPRRSSRRRSTRTRCCGAGTWSPCSSSRSSLASRAMLDLSSCHPSAGLGARERGETHFVPDLVPAVSGTTSLSAFQTLSISIELHSAVARQILVYAEYVVPWRP
eukprot:3854655-Pleurochrysis_carterae.AAC.1